ncbi:MAG: hypothetical protein HFH47_01475 [Bacilli bacterium]|nr:hypothetical protein [Bacilli bacterium]
MKLKPIKKYLIIFVACFFLFPLASNAQCSYERQAELSKIASNVKFSYTYDVIENEPHFSIAITNLTNDIYIRDDNFNHYINGVGEINLKYDIDGIAIQFDIYSNDVNCKAEKILTKYINLPNYNRYNQFSECTEEPDFKYCEIWSNTNSIDEAEFRKQIFEYSHSQKKNVPQENKTNLSEWIKNNQVYIISVIMCILIIVVMIVVRSVKKHEE